jgi:ACT domain-containing protein
MARGQLDDRQIKFISALAEGDKTIVEICEVYNVPRSTYYDWRKKDYFIQALQELLDEKKNAAIDRLKDKVDDYLGILDNLAMKSKNDMVRYHATNTLLGHAGLIVTNKDEVTFKNKNDSESKNELMELWKQKKEQQQDQEQVH